MTFLLSSSLFKFALSLGDREALRQALNICGIFYEQTSSFKYFVHISPLLVFPKHWTTRLCVVYSLCCWQNTNRRIKDNPFSSITKQKQKDSEFTNRCVAGVVSSSNYAHTHYLHSTCLPAGRHKQRRAVYVEHQKS